MNTHGPARAGQIGFIGLLNLHDKSVGWLTHGAMKFPVVPPREQPVLHARGRWPTRNPSHTANHPPLGHRRALRRVPPKVAPVLEIEWSMPDVVAHDC